MIKTPEKILAMPSGEAAVYLNKIQSKILKKHFGSVRGYCEHRRRVNELISLAEKKVSEMDLDKVEIEDWQRESSTNHHKNTFNVCPESIAFHRVMTGMKREEGLI
ncbi:MAG: hypothetical protein DRP56_02795 [Planctomycetota bacterium]|nr:MAG: hypothetical protein DRP56_02795 [Planctomycetota bacterium]